MSTDVLISEKSTIKGWLWKLSITNSGMLSNWKKRFFVLKEEYGTKVLKYYTDTSESPSALKGKIDLTDVFTIKADIHENDITGPKNYLKFELIKAWKNTEKQRYLLAAERNSKEKTIWINGLASALDLDLKAGDDFDSIDSKHYEGFEVEIPITGGGELETEKQNKVHHDISGVSDSLLTRKSYQVNELKHTGKLYIKVEHMGNGYRWIQVKVDFYKSYLALTTVKPIEQKVRNSIFKSNSSNASSEGCSFFKFNLKTFKTKVSRPRPRNWDHIQEEQFYIFMLSNVEERTRTQSVKPLINKKLYLGVVDETIRKKWMQVIHDTLLLEEKLNITKINLETEKEKKTIQQNKQFHQLQDKTENEQNKKLLKPEIDQSKETPKIPKTSYKSLFGTIETSSDTKADEKRKEKKEEDLKAINNFNVSQIKTNLTEGNENQHERERSQILNGPEILSTNLSSHLDSPRSKEGHSTTKYKHPDKKLTPISCTLFQDLSEGDYSICGRCKVRRIDHFSEMDVGMKCTFLKYEEEVEVSLRYISAFTSANLESDMTHARASSSSGESRDYRSESRASFSGLDQFDTDGNHLIAGSIEEGDEEDEEENTDLVNDYQRRSRERQSSSTEFIVPIENQQTERHVDRRTPYQVYHLRLNRNILGLYQNVNSKEPLHDFGIDLRTSITYFDNENEMKLTTAKAILYIRTHKSRHRERIYQTINQLMEHEHNVHSARVNKAKTVLEELGRDQNIIKSRVTSRKQNLLESEQKKSLLRENFELNSKAFDNEIEAPDKMKEEELDKINEDDKLQLKALHDEEKKVKRVYYSLTITNGKGDQRKIKDINHIKYEFFSDSESYNVAFNPYIEKKIKEYSGILEYDKEFKCWLEDSNCLSKLNEALMKAIKFRSGIWRGLLNKYRRILEKYESIHLYVSKKERETKHGMRDENVLRMQMIDYYEFNKRGYLQMRPDEEVLECLDTFRNDIYKEEMDILSSISILTKNPVSCLEIIRHPDLINTLTQGTYCIEPVNPHMIHLVTALLITLTKFSLEGCRLVDKRIRTLGFGKSNYSRYSRFISLMQCKNISRDTIPVMLQLINDTIARHEDIYDRLVIRRLVRKAGIQKCIDNVITLLTHGATPSRYSIVSPRSLSPSSGSSSHGKSSKWNLLHAFSFSTSLSTSDDLSPSPNTDNIGKRKRESKLLKSVSIVSDSTIVDDAREEDLKKQVAYDFAKEHDRFVVDGSKDEDIEEEQYREGDLLHNLGRLRLLAHTTSHVRFHQLNAIQIGIYKWLKNGSRYKDDDEDFLQSFPALLEDDSVIRLLNDAKLLAKREKEIENKKSKNPKNKDKSTSPKENRKFEKMFIGLNDSTPENFPFPSNGKFINPPALPGGITHIYLESRPAEEVPPLPFPTMGHYIIPPPLPGGITHIYRLPMGLNDPVPKEFPYPTFGHYLAPPPLPDQGVQRPSQVENHTTSSSSIPLQPKGPFGGQNPFAGGGNPFAGGANPFANLQKKGGGGGNLFAGGNNPFAKVNIGTPKDRTNEKIIKAKPKPKTKMQSFFWEKLSNDVNKKSWWADEKLGGELEVGISTEEDQEILQSLNHYFEKIEKCFASSANQRRKNINNGLKIGGAKDEEDSKKGEKQAPQRAPKIQLLDKTKSQNIEIAIHKLGMTCETLQMAVNNVDFAILTTQNLEILPTLFLSNDDQQLLREYISSGANYDDLGEAEKFAWALMNCKRPKEKLFIAAKIHYGNSDLDSIANDINHLEAAANELKDKRFHKLLKLILHLGNYINSGTSQALKDGVGIRLTTLDKLATTRCKSTDDPRLKTMMHLLVHIGLNEVEDTENHCKWILELPMALEACKVAATIDASYVESSLKDFDNELETVMNEFKLSNEETLNEFKLKQEIERKERLRARFDFMNSQEELQKSSIYPSVLTHLGFVTQADLEEKKLQNEIDSKPPPMKFSPDLIQIIEKLQTRYNTMKTDFDSTLDLISKLMVHYGEVPSKMIPSDLFSTVSRFAQELKSTITVYKNQTAAIERQKRLEEAKKKERAERAAREEALRLLKIEQEKLKASLAKENIHKMDERNDDLLKTTQSEKGNTPEEENINHKDPMEKELTIDFESSGDLESDSESDTTESSRNSLSEDDKSTDSLDISKLSIIEIDLNGDDSEQLFNLNREFIEDYESLLEEDEIEDEEDDTDEDDDEYIKNTIYGL